MKILTGRQNTARRTMLYGVHGVGKSTWASQAPKPLILNLEDGVGDIDCAKTEVILSVDSFMETLRWLATEKHDFKTVVIDTLDWLESLIHAAVAKKANKTSIAEIGYGAGYKTALAEWDRVLMALDWLRTDRGMSIVALAHAQIKRFDSPETESYDRYQPALHETASAMWQEWFDEVLFASYKVFTSKEDQGFNKTRNIAAGDGQRYVRTQESAAVLAKNRLRMPVEIEFSWQAYAAYFPKSGNIDGVVTDGSSKK
jgi:hypothetical protein